MSEITLGILGGGQLGSMLSIAAKKLNIKTIIYCDDQDAPAQKFCDEFIYAKYDDKNEIYNFAKKVDIITYEFENIPFETLNELNKLKTVLPKPSVNRLIQHRYDGKGQYPIKNIKEIENLNIDFSKEYILEKIVKLKKEISVIVTRFNNNKYEIYEPIENTHEDQILRHSKIPADISEKLFDQSKDWAIIIAEELKYIGTLCVEFFIDRNNNLYVNEIAPRVHNSGHLTINAYNISQFENHIRAVCSLKQVPLKKLSNAEMINLIGNQIISYRENPKLSDNQFLFDYLKKEIKEKRKMGHLTTLK